MLDAQQLTEPVVRKVPEFWCRVQISIAKKVVEKWRGFRLSALGFREDKTHLRQRGERMSTAQPNVG